LKVYWTSCNDDQENDEYDSTLPVELKFSNDLADINEKRIVQEVKGKERKGEERRREESPDT
jgi:hypothetical protein